MNSTKVHNAPVAVEKLNVELAKSLFLSSSTRVEAFLSPKCNNTRFPICELPTVLILSIIHYLDIPDFFRMVCTCKRLASFAKFEDLWQFLCVKRWRELRLPLIKSFPVSPSLGWKNLARCFMVQVNLLSDKSKFTGEGFSRTSTDLYFGHWAKGQCEGHGFRLYFQTPLPELPPNPTTTTTTTTNPTTTSTTTENSDTEKSSTESSSNESSIKYDLFEGEWARDLPDGFGVKRWSNGDSYSGNWRQGYTHGHGVYTWGIGDRYDGNYDEGKRNGEGTYYYADGSTYVGSWLNHKQHGFGKRKYLNGNSYEGEWCEGNLEGKGTFIWQDNSDYHGDVYTGYWRDNSEHGQGEYRSVFGTIYSGVYNMGTRQGNGSFTHADGYSWEGSWNNDIPQDLDSALHPKMREVLESGKCTQTLTHRTPFYGQVLFRCLDCHGQEDMEKRRYVCQNCIDICHKNHRIEKKIWTCGRSFCWCVENCSLGEKDSKLGGNCNCK